MADIFKNLRGIIGSLFQIGHSGPNIKNNNGVVEFRNADDNGYAIARSAAPVGDNDVTNKKYVDSLEKPLIVKRQADCSVAIPNNTTVRGYVVVTTAGSGAAIGDILYDNGLDDSQPMEILTSIEGRTIAVTDSLTGGTVSFEGDSIYVWDEDTTTWLKIGDVGGVTGAVRCIRKVIDNSASQDSSSSIPANARILSCNLEITTAYSGGATIAIGNSGNTSLIMATTENNPQKSSRTYSKEQDTGWGGTALPVRTTITGAPSAGAGVVTVLYASPNA